MIEPSDPKLLQKLLNIMEQDIIPLTVKGVEDGNKIFGAALLKKSDFSLVLAETNGELENPLLHGEMNLMRRFYELPEADRPLTSELIFLSTHEPCTMCMSAITWAGFDNYFYFFSHVDSKDAFAIPHDLKIMKELYGLNAGEYARENAFFKAFDIIEEIEKLDESNSGMLLQIAQIKQKYQELSEIYQNGKSDNSIPLS